MIYIDDDIQGFDLESALPLLSEQRREQVLRFKFELGRKTCAMAYMLLRRALHEEYGIDEAPVFEYGEHGKPFIIGHPDIHFNFSHCREAVACAVSNQPIGIDVESIREFTESLVRYTMNDEEAREIESADDPTRAFIRFWTMKEAKLKLSGHGICDNMKQVLDGTEHFQTVFNEKKGYIYSVIS